MCGVFRVLQSDCIRPSGGSEREMRRERVVGTRFSLSKPGIDRKCAPHSVGKGEPAKVFEQESDILRAVLKEEKVTAICQLDW